MTEDELCRLSAGEAARRIAGRTLSPVALMEAVLARAARLDPALRLFAEPMSGAAREAAEQAEAAVEAGSPIGPLHGVPITIKDNIAVAGVPLRAGSRAAPAVVPAADGLTVQRVRAAGAIVVGKTTLPEFAHKVLTDNDVDGVTRNPWRLDRTPGGSSGGAAAALAAGVAPLAIGTDGGGSIRCPASCTGTVGLKPTLGRVPNETAPDGFGSFFNVGPMARTVADVRLLLSVLEGAHPADPHALSRARLPHAHAARRAGPLRIGVVEQFGDYPTSPAVAAVARRAMDALSAGAAVTRLQPACFRDLFPTYQVLATTAHAARFGHLLDGAGDRLTASMADSIGIGRRWSGVALLQAQDRRTALFRAVQDVFETVDVIAMPAMTAPPPELDFGGSIATEGFGEWAAPLYPFNMTGHPALSLPAGFTDDGLPVGLQLVGPWDGDTLVLDVAECLQDALGLARVPELLA